MSDNPNIPAVLDSKIPFIIVASIMLVACAASLVVFYRGIPVRFSLRIIIMIIVVNVSYIIYNVLSIRSIALLAIKILFDGLIQLQVPVNLLFTERQWVAFKRYNLSLAVDSTERLRLKIELVRIEHSFKIMLSICCIFMMGYSLSKFICNYYIYFVETCESDSSNCPFLTYFFYLLIFSMASVFLIDDICSVLLIISVKQIHEVITKYFAH